MSVKKVIIFGDSLLKYIRQEEEHYRIISERGLNTVRFIKQLSRGQHDKVIHQHEQFIICLGTNNLRDYTPEETIEDLSQIRALILSKKRDVTVILSTLIPREDTYKAKAKLTSNLLNAKGKPLGWTICQLHKTFLRKPKKPKQTPGEAPKPPKPQKKFLYEDGYHLSDDGNIRVKAFLTNYVERVCIRKQN